MFHRTNSLVANMNCFVFKFKNRNALDISNRYLAEIYTNGPKFEVDLVSADNKIVSAHKFVVSMFSTHLRDYLREFKSKGKICGESREIHVFLFFPYRKNVDSQSKYWIYCTIKGCISKGLKNFPVFSSVARILWIHFEASGQFVLQWPDYGWRRSQTAHRESAAILESGWNCYSDTSTACSTVIDQT